MHSLAALIATIPPPPFRNLEIGPLTLHGYGLVIGVAIVAAIWVTEWALKRQHVDPSRFTGVALIAVLAGFIGARLYHVASEPTHFFHHPGDIVKVWEGGLGIYGGVLLGAVVGLWIAPRFGIPRRAAADAAAVGIPLAQAIGRFGNYLNQELYGRPFDGAWALEVDRDRRPFEFIDEPTFHPTFAYEQLGNLAVAGLMLVLLLRWKSRPRGILLPLYVSAYSLVRMLVEPMRIDDAHEWLGVRQNVWVAASLFVAGLVVALVMWRRDPARRA
jgi:prolipoprotein diacylglyceryl transferase